MTMFKNEKITLNFKQILTFDSCESRLFGANLLTHKKPEVVQP